MSQIDTIQIFVEGEGLKDMILIEVDPKEAVEVILTRAKEQGAHVDDETVVLIEEHEEPLDRHSLIHEKGIRKHHRVHIHRCKAVNVTINYQGEHKLVFRPTVTVAAVRNGALKKFPIDEALKPNMILRFCGTTNEPDLDRQLGTYVEHGDCSICFDLILDPRVQG